MKHLVALFYFYWLFKLSFKCINIKEGKRRNTFITIWLHAWDNSSNSNKKIRKLGTKWCKKLRTTEIFRSTTSICSRASTFCVKKTSILERWNVENLKFPWKFFQRKTVIRLNAPQRIICIEFNIVIRFVCKLSHCNACEYSMVLMKHEIKL